MSARTRRRNDHYKRVLSGRASVDLKFGQQYAVSYGTLTPLRTRHNETPPGRIRLTAMLNTTQNVLIVLMTLAASLLLMALLNRFWPWEKRRAHNDLIGWQLSLIGTTYAVIIGFMLYTVWTDFGAADLNADAEANALLSVFHLAEGLPDQQRVELRKFARAYADSVIDIEWPAMAEDKIAFNVNAANRGMWDTLLSVKGASPTESTAEGQALRDLSEMNQHRRLRQLQSTSHLPGILWCVLLIGGVVTIGSACMFGSGSVALHALQVSAFSLLIALVLAAIADIDRPFQGSVHVSDVAFRRAQQTMATY